MRSFDKHETKDLHFFCERCYIEIIICINIFFYLDRISISIISVIFIPQIAN